MKFQVRSGLEDLPERIDISLITEIATKTCAPPPNVLREHLDVPISAGASLAPSPLSFSLISADGSLADQIAPDQSRWADWTDGLNMLRHNGGHVATEETAGFVQALTEIGLLIKLLGEWGCLHRDDDDAGFFFIQGADLYLIDLTGERVEIPSGLNAGQPPTNTDFFFSDLFVDG